MKLSITLNQTQAVLEITKNGLPLDSKKLSYYHDLDVKLITSIDNLLRKNMIDISSINSYKIQGNLGINSTSYTIAQAVVEALKLRT